MCEDHECGLAAHLYQPYETGGDVDRPTPDGACLDDRRRGEVSHCLVDHPQAGQCGFAVYQCFRVEAPVVKELGDGDELCRDGGRQCDFESVG